MYHSLKYRQSVRVVITLITKCTNSSLDQLREVTETIILRLHGVRSGQRLILIQPSRCRPRGPLMVEQPESVGVSGRHTVTDSLLKYRVAKR